MAFKTTRKISNKYTKDKKTVRIDDNTIIFVNKDIPDNITKERYIEKIKYSRMTNN